MMRKILLLLVAFSLIFTGAMPALAGELPAQGGFYSIRNKNTETISEGATLSQYFLALNGRPVKAAVLQLDLTNPYLKVESLVGADDTLENKQSVSKMAARAGAVAAVNAGFFIIDQGKPLGTVIRDGDLVSSPIMRSDMPVFALDKEKRPIMSFFGFSGSVKAENGTAFPLFGVNKLLYNLENGEISDVNHLTLYNRYWGPNSRGGVGDLPGAMEVVVENDTVTRQVYAASPLPIPSNGYVLWGHGTAADFIRKNLTVGSRVQADYRTYPAFDQLLLATGSNSFLVRQGRVAQFQEDLKGKNSRTAVASANGGKTLLLVAVEKSDQSTGVEQQELAELLVAMGAEEAVNLDGGGSTTLVAKHLGDAGMSNVVQPKEGWQRPVTDALGIFNTAPAGKPAGLIITGPDLLLAGTSAQYSVKGYDSHYYPWQPQNVAFSVSGDGRVESGTFTAGKGGDVILEAFSGGVKGDKKIHVVGASEIKALKVEPSTIKVRHGEKVSLSFSVETLDGRVFPLDARYVQAETSLGQVSGGSFVAGEASGRGALKFSYQGIEAQIPVQVGSMFSDIDNHWACEQINELAGTGIVAGFEDGTFRPDAPVTRAQVVSLLARLMHWPPGEGKLSFKDAVPAWAEDAVGAAVERGVLKGYPDGRFLPDRPVTRAEIAVILDKTLKLSSAASPLNFKDSRDVPSWARDPLSRVVSAGIMKGYEGNVLKPQSNLTRAEMSALINGLIRLNYVKVEH